MNILLNSNSTTEDETEEEAPTTASSSSKKTKRRRRNFSSSTSSSYSSSLATTSTVHSTSQTATAGSSSRKQDNIAFRTRSRTHSVERQEEATSPSSVTVGAEEKLKASRTRSHLIRSDSDDSQEEQDLILSKSRSSRLSRNNNSSSSKPLKSSSGSKVEYPSRQLRSSHNPKESLATSVPRKRQRIGEATSSSASSSFSGAAGASGSQHVDRRTGSSSKATPNLGTKLAKSYSSRESPQHPYSSVNSSQNQQESDLTTNRSLSTLSQGHPQPQQNLLRRSSRGKGVTSSSSTTGSCVSFYNGFLAFVVLKQFLSFISLDRFHHQLPLTLSLIVT